MAGNWSAGLTDQDELSQFPSAASPLSAVGLDPDMVRANPALLQSLSGGSNPDMLASLSATPPEGDKPPAAVPGPAAMPGSAPVPPPAAAPAPSAEKAGAAGGAGDTAPTPDAETVRGYGMEGLGMLAKNLREASANEGKIETSNPEVARLTQQRERLATPAPLFDPKTGKKLDSTQEYNPDTGQMVTINPKPSTGTRIWRGVRGGLNGLLTGGIRGGILGAIDPALVGSEAYGAPSKAYEHAEEHREQELGATDRNLKNTFDTWKAAQDAVKARATEFRANASLGKDLTTGATGIANSDTEAQKAANEKTRLDSETPEAKANAKLSLNQAELDQRGQQIATDPVLRRLSPLQQVMYRLNGKVPDPQQPTEGEINAGNAARALVIFRAQHGGKDPQTLEDFNSIQSAARGDLKKSRTDATPEQIKAVADKKEAAIQKANEEFAKNSGTLGEKAARADYRRALQAAQNGFEEDASILGVAGDHHEVTFDAKGNPVWAPVKAPTQQAAVAPPAGATDEIFAPDGSLVGHRINGQLVWLAGKEPKKK